MDLIADVCRGDGREQRMSKELNSERLDVIKSKSRKTNSEIIRKKKKKCNAHQADILFLS
jgi:hypothetical protein